MTSHRNSCPGCNPCNWNRRFHPGNVTRVQCSVTRVQCNVTRVQFHATMLMILTFTLLLSLPAGAISRAETDNKPVLVGVRIVPPFVIAEPDGSYSGLTIALWEHIASEMNLEFEYVERDIAGLIEGVAQAGQGPEFKASPDTKVDAAHESATPERQTGINANASGGYESAASDSDGTKPLFAAASALTITAEREEILDFTHPFFVTGLGIAVPYQPTGLWQAIFSIFSTEFLWVVVLLILLLLFWGVLVWYFERVRNPDDFGGTPAEGIGSGFWWAAVTMTTVGYGDKAPKTFAGRMIGFIWMFAGIILISFFTASIASSLTVTQLDSRVSGPQDLPFVRVGVLQHSATIDYLEENRIRYRTFEAIDDGLRAVADDQIDAFVHDAPIIRYYSVQNFRNEVRVLPGTFNDQYYGIALPLESPYRNVINRIMLDFIASDEWEQLNHRYLGSL